MQVKSKLLSILRMIEAFTTSQSRFAKYDDQDFIEEINKLIDDNDRETIASVLKAMMLLTAANVDTVRDPSRFEESGTDYWDMYIDAYDYGISTIIEGLELPLNFNSKPTQQDYIMAKKLLPIIGSHKFTPSNYQGDLDLDKEIYGTINKDRLKGLKLFRGLKDMSLDSLFLIMDKKPWSMTRGVSTSFDIRRARHFAGVGDDLLTKQGPAILFKIRNKEGRGFHAGRLSKYRFEEEVILSGNIRILSWTFKGEGTLLADQVGTSVKKKVGLVRVTFNERDSTLLVENKSGEIILQKSLSNIQEFKDFISNVWSVFGAPIEIEGETLHIRIPKTNMLLEVESEVVDS